MTRMGVQPSWTSHPASGGQIECTMTAPRPLVFVLSLLTGLAASLALATAPSSVAGHPDWTTHHWGVGQGLPVNTINAMVRDRDGFLWLATMDGLVRFDGASFEIFDTLNSPGLAGNRLLVLQRDGDNGLWMTTEDTRLVRYRSGRFKTLGHADGLPHEAVIALSAGDQAVWVGTREGAARWTGAGFKALSAALWNEATTAIFQAGDGEVWLGSESGRLLRWRPDGTSQTLTVTGRVWQMASDGQGGVWIAHDAGLARWDGTRLIIEPWVDFGVQRLLQVGPILYLAFEAGLYRLERGRRPEFVGAFRGSGRERIAAIDEAGTWLNLTDGLIRNGELILAPRFVVSDWLADDADGVLVATAGDGLYRLGPNAFNRPAGPEALLEAPVYPIVEAPDGAVWIGTSGQGLYRIALGERVAQRIAEAAAPDVVYSVLPDEGEQAWIGGEGLWRLDADTVHQQEIPEDLRMPTVRLVYRDARQRVWVGTDEHGLWQLEAGSWQRMAGPTGEDISRARVVAERDGMLWFGTNGDGLLSFDEALGFEALGEGRPGRLIRALHFDTQGRLLVGTEDRGLCRLDRPADGPNDSNLRCLDRRDGLPSDGIHQILPDSAGSLWMSTNRGIFSISGEVLDHAFDGGQLSARLLTEADGLPDREANGGVQSAGMVDAPGRLWFPTMRGPVALDTARLPAPSVLPRTVIEELVNPNGLFVPDQASVDLPVGVRNLTLRYTAPDFRVGSALRFETRLVGLEPGWQPVGERREVDYTYLPHGAYRFEVRALADDGQGGSIAGLDLVIPPFFHETFLFRLGFVLLLLALAWLAWRERERSLVLDRARLESQVHARTEALSEAKLDAERGRDQIARQAERLERLDEEKRAFFANISHELRTPLTLLLGPLEQGRHDPDSLAGQLPLMHRNARRLNRLVEQILDLHRIEGGQLSVEPELHDLVAWARSTTGLFRSLAESRDMSISFDGPPEGVLAWFDTNQMDKVLGNLLSNAIRYCRSGDAVAVQVARKGETAIVEVSDTGPGLAAVHLPRLFERFYRAVEHGSPIEGTGIGLALARKLALLHGGDLRVDSTEGAGARFCLRWPARAVDGRLAAAPTLADAQEPDPTKARRLAQARVPAGRDAARILVVDDNPDLRQWLAHVLGERYVVDEAADGQSALTVMQAHLPDLVVSDWTMPGMDGMALLARMRDTPELKALPVIMLSARAEIGDRLRGLEAGAVAYVQKPFHADMLLAQIETLLRQNLRLREALAGSPKVVLH